VLDRESFTVCMLEKLMWIAAFMLVGARHDGCTVGEVESRHTEEVRTLIEEMIAGLTATQQGVAFDEGTVARLMSYARAVAHFPTAVKELEWRNGFFYDISTAQTAVGKPDPFPTHTAWLKEVGAV
jgi:ketopantoate reductase